MHVAGTQSIQTTQSPPTVSDLSSEGSGPLGKALARESPTLWERLCANSRGLFPEMAVPSKDDLGEEDGCRASKEGSCSTRSMSSRCSRRMSDEQQRILTDASYRPGGKIGQGSTSIVYSGVRRSDRMKVALKTLNTCSKESNRLAHREQKILSQLSHPNIVKMHGLIHLEGHPCLALEYFEGTELLLAVHGQVDRCLPEPLCGRLTAGLVQAVEYLHRHDFVHCDIRPQNIRVAHDLKQLKLLDFGSSIWGKDRLSTPFALPERGAHVACAAPEVILGEEPSPRSDVWQVGLCTYFMLSGSLPQRRDHCKPTHEAVRAVATTQTSFSSSKWVHVPEPVKVTLQCCLMIDKLERPSCHELFTRSLWLQPWMKESGGGAARKERRLDSTAASEVAPQTSLQGGLEPDGDLCAPLTSLSAASTKTCGSAKTCGSVPSSCTSGISAELSGSSLLHLRDFCSNAVVVEPLGERATILLVNYAEKTCKVRLQDGSVRVVPAENVRRP